jgi:uncharacterized protein YbjT (DUF2867 family)
MQKEPIVLVVGVTGAFIGYKIATALQKKGGVKVRALVRSEQSYNAEKQRKLDELKFRGVELIQGDLLRPETLLKACEGVQAVVSAVSGDANSVVTGQQNLIEVAEMQGIQRFIPSDYSVDYRKLDWGDNDNLDMRKRLLIALEQSKLEYTLVLNGILTEMLFSPFGGIFDFATQTFNYWGDGETLFDTMTSDDVAKFTAEAVLDPTLADTALEIAGDTLTMKQLLTRYDRVKGRSLIEKRIGSVEDLYQTIQEKKKNATSPYEYLSLQYHYTLVSGKGKLDAIADSRYPHLCPTSVHRYLQTTDVQQKLLALT